MPKFSLKKVFNQFIMLLFMVISVTFCGGCEKQHENVFYLETMDASADAMEAEVLEKTRSQASEEQLNEKESAQRVQVSPEKMQEGAEAEEGSANVCIVHICGAVRNSGVYELAAGARIVDAVNAAGGFLEEADQTALNLAALVEDGSQIYILTKQESAARAADPAADGQSGSGAEESDGKVNINRADLAELMRLPGVGESKAAAIIAWRKENGNFQTIEDIMQVSGIKEAAFAKIKDKIKV